MVHYDQLNGDPAKQYGFTKSGVIIIGAGFSGICMAIKLLEAGIKDIVIVEKGSGVGGTWKDNAYPGCCCDILSHLYCYSFAQNPDWSRSYPEQEEILNYIGDVARKYDLYRLVRFSSEVTAATWDSSSKQWKVHIQVLASKEAEFCESYTMETSFLIAGVGQLNQPCRPEISGEGTFQGKIMHSARWDWSYDLRDKRIGVIGNGATAVQIVPEVAKIAAHLTIFQRSPNWLIPRLNQEISKWKRSLYKNLPVVLNRARAEIMDGRESFYQALIQRDSTASSEITQFCRGYIQSQLPDLPDLREKLTPNYPPGCKRILLSDDYYPTLCLPHVKLETGQIEGITEEGISVKTSNEEESRLIDLDLIVFATGFQARDFMYGINVQGVATRSLDTIWAEGASALYGVTVESLPNFGMLYGPNTNLGHNSIILMIESQARYITTLVKEVVQSGQEGQVLSITPKTQRIKEWNQRLQNNLAGSSFADPRCSSWYKTDDGLVTNNWSGTVVEYQKLMSEVDWTDYDIEGTETQQIPKGKIHIGRVVEETLVGTQTLATGTLLGALAIAGYVYHSRGISLLKHVL